MKTRKPHRQDKNAGHSRSLFPSVPENEFILQVAEGIQMAECCIKLATSEKSMISRDKLLSKASEKLDSILYACAKIRNGAAKRQRIAELQTTLSHLQKPTLAITKNAPVETITEEMIDTQEKHLASLRKHRDEIELYLDKIEKTPLMLKLALPIEHLTPNDRKALGDLTAQIHMQHSLKKRIETAEIELKKMQDEYDELNKTSPSASSKTPLSNYINTTDDGQSSDDSTLLSRHSNATPSPKSR